MGIAKHLRRQTKIGTRGNSNTKKKLLRQPDSCRLFRPSFKICFRSLRKWRSRLRMYKQTKSCCRLIFCKEFVRHMFRNKRRPMRVATRNILATSTQCNLALALTHGHACLYSYQMHMHGCKWYACPCMHTPAPNLSLLRLTPSDC